MRVSSSLRPSFVVGPPGCPIERKRQTILWQVDGGGHEVIDRGEASWMLLSWLTYYHLMRRSNVATLTT